MSNEKEVLLLGYTPPEKRRNIWREMFDHYVSDKRTAAEDAFVKMVTFEKPNERGNFIFFNGYGKMRKGNK